MYLDPDERDPNQKFDTAPTVQREIVKARLSSRSVVINLPANLREPLGIHAGCKIMITLDLENERLIVTRE